MHSNPLGPSEKNSFCLKVQRMRDMCDPYGKKPIWGHTQRLKKVLCELMCAKSTPQRPEKNANPSGLSENNVYSVESFAISQNGNFRA